MKQVLLLCFLGAFTFSAVSQGYQSVVTGGSTNSDYGKAVSLDQDGNSYLLGTFRGNVSFGSTELSAFTQDAFLTKLDSDNNYVWVRQIASSNAVGARDVVAHDDGNVYVLTHYRDAVTIDNGSFDDINIDAPGGVRDMLVIKYNSNGDYQEHYVMGTTNEVNPQKLEIKGSRVYVAGGLENENEDHEDGFLTLTGLNNQTVWTKLGRSIHGDDLFNSMTIDDEGILHVAGYFHDSLIVDNDTLFTAAQQSALILAFDSNGTLLQSRTFGGPGFLSLASTMSIVEENGIVNAVINFGGQINIAPNDDIVAQGAQDELVLNMTFNELVGYSENWREHLEGDGSNFGTFTNQEVALYNGVPVVLSHIFGTVDIGDETYAAGSSQDVVMYMVNENGSFLVNEQLGNIYNVFSYGLSINGNTASIAGAYSGSLDFGDFNETSSFTTIDFYLTEYLLEIPAEASIDYQTGTYCEGSLINVDITTTGSFDSGNSFIVQLSDGTGSFSDPLDLETIQAVSGLNTDIMIPFDLDPGADYQLRVVSTSPSYTSVGGIVFEIAEKPELPIIVGSDNVNVDATESYSVTDNSGSTFQWIVEEGDLLSGQNTNEIDIQWSTTAVSADVVVIETNEAGCQSDSAFLMVEIDQMLSVNSFANDFAVNIFPNPANNEVRIDFTEEKSLARITLTDLNGKVVWNEWYGQTNKMSQVIIPISELRPGFYFVSIAADDSFATKKIVVQ